ncbi:MAG: YjbQ family protein [Candidatus Aenigmarchaeota archaeon]|nr:YjbQ family protein [Candidatus Aenigmarchaeota archaeon]
MLRPMEFFVNTKRKQELANITNRVEEAVRKSSVENGICVVYVPHATAGIIVNENYDPSVCEDIVDAMEKLIPIRAGYRHDAIDSNAHAHIKASIIGPGKTIPIENGKLKLGTWQGIALAEFDGPRERTVIVKVIKG